MPVPDLGLVSTADSMSAVETGVAVKAPPLAVGFFTRPFSATTLLHCSASALRFSRSRSALMAAFSPTRTRRKIIAKVMLSLWECQCFYHSRANMAYPKYFGPVEVKLRGS